MSAEEDGERIVFPELHEAVLDDERLGALLADIAAVATVHEAQVRINGRASAPSFAEAADAFRSGAARALQVQYAYAGDVWRDTLIRTPAGVKLVRMRVEEPA